MRALLSAQETFIHKERFDPPRCSFLRNDVITRTEALGLIRMHTAKTPKVDSRLLGSKRCRLLPDVRDVFTGCGFAGEVTTSVWHLQQRSVQVQGGERITDRRLAQ